MLINEQTKIAALLKHHPDALEAIITISSDFKKLRNPILRKLMAGRTSISMASKIGKCSPEDFFKVLMPLGFEIDKKQPQIEKETTEQVVPDFLKNINEREVIDFDVREMLASGADPLKEIQQKVKSLENGQVLKIINTFEPVPLIKLLEKQGFSSFVKNITKNHIETFFFKENVSVSQEIETPTTDSSDWVALLQQYDGKLVEIDVRHLEMPMPMMTILESLESLPENKALYVHHKRIPVFLLTELKEREFDFRIKNISEGEVYLLIFKN